MLRSSTTLPHANHNKWLTFMKTFQWYFHLTRQFIKCLLQQKLKPAIVSDDEDDTDGFLATCKNSGCLDHDIYNIFECYLNLPKIPDPAQNPLSFACIRKQQQQDKQLLALQAKYPDQYIYKSLDKDVEDIIVMYVREIVPTNNGVLHCPNKCLKQPLSGSIK